MAIQFPNFLGVPIQKPDYSGVGDIVSNYYSGKEMPKDDLIKAVQAQFAQPTAEATLSKLQAETSKAGGEGAKAQALAEILKKHLQRLNRGQTQTADQPSSVEKYFVNPSVVKSDSSRFGGNATSDIGDVIANKLLFGEAETPQQKQQREVQTSVMKASAVPSAQEQQDIANTIDLSEEVFKGVEDLKNRSFLSPGIDKRRKLYADKLSKTSLFPRGKGSMEQALEILQPSYGEYGSKTYDSRMNEMLVDMAPRAARSFIYKGRAIPSIVKKYLYIPVQTPDGKLVNVPATDLKKVLTSGGRIYDLPADLQNIDRSQLINALLRN